MMTGNEIHGFVQRRLGRQREQAEVHGVLCAHLTAGGQVAPMRRWAQLLHQHANEVRPCNHAGQPLLIEDGHAPKRTLHQLPVDLRDLVLDVEAGGVGRHVVLDQARQILAFVQELEQVLLGQHPVQPAFGCDRQTADVALDQQRDRLLDRLFPVDADDPDLHHVAGRQIAHFVERVVQAGGLPGGLALAIRITSHRLVLTKNHTHQHQRPSRSGSSLRQCIRLRSSAFRQPNSRESPASRVKYVVLRSVGCSRRPRGGPTGQPPSRLASTPESFIMPLPGLPACPIGFQVAGNMRNWSIHAQNRTNG